MQRLAGLAPGALLTLAGLVLYFVDSLLPWQQACVQVGDFSACGSLNEWHGIGVLAALLGVALLVWEAIPLFRDRPALGGVHPRFVSIVLAAALVLFTFVTTLTHDDFRTFWAWAGLILAVVVAAGVWMQAREEGVERPSFGSRDAAATTDPAASAPDPYPPAPDPRPEATPATPPSAVGDASMAPSEAAARGEAS
jgi:hypothetical protein